MTKIRRIALTLAASSAIGSLAVLSPLAAQAKTAEWLTTKAIEPVFRRARIGQHPSHPRGRHR